MPYRLRAGRKRHVDTLLPKACIQRLLFQKPFAGLNRGGDRILHFVEWLTTYPTLFRAQLAELLHKAGHAALLAARANAQAFWRRKVGRRLGAPEAARLGTVEAVD